jgi:hypothetical protein
MITVRWLTEEAERWGVVFVKRTLIAWLFKYPGPAPGMNHIDAVRQLDQTGEITDDDLIVGAETGTGRGVTADPPVSRALADGIRAALGTAESQSR